MTSPAEGGDGRRRGPEADPSARRRALVVGTGLIGGSLGLACGPGVGT